MRYKELILGLTFVLGLIAAELPQNVKNYTQTSAKYSLESYGNGLAAVGTAESAMDDGDARS